MTTFCSHTQDPHKPLAEDCDCCTLRRGKVVGFIAAEGERTEIRARQRKSIRRFHGGVKIGSGWRTYSMRGVPLD